MVGDFYSIECEPAHQFNKEVSPEYITFNKETMQIVEQSANAASVFAAIAIHNAVK
jgi:hypothetical protein